MALWILSNQFVHISNKIIKWKSKLTLSSTILLTTQHAQQASTHQFQLTPFNFAKTYSLHSSSANYNSIHLLVHDLQSLFQVDKCQQWFSRHAHHDYLAWAHHRQASLMIILAGDQACASKLSLKWDPKPICTYHLAFDLCIYLLTVLLYSIKTKNTLDKTQSSKDKKIEKNTSALSDGKLYQYDYNVLMV